MGIKLDCTVGRVLTVLDCTVGTICTVSSPSTGRPGTAGTACGSTVSGLVGGGGGRREGADVCTVGEDCCTGEGTDGSAGILGGNLNVRAGRAGGGIGEGKFLGSGMFGMVKMSIDGPDGKLNI